MFKTTLEITLTLIGPLLTQSSAPGEIGLDAVIARNHKGQAYLPGTLISGKLRQAWEELQHAAASNIAWFQPNVEQWLGKRNEFGLPKNKRLVFSDFVLTGPAESTETTAVRDRIKIDSERGAVGKHQLVMIENSFISGEEYSFIGKLHFFSPSSVGTDSIIQHVRAGIQWFSQLGALRSVGFGRVVKAEITDPRITPLKKPETPGTNVIRVGVLIEPEYPFCISGKTLADNVFESEVIIPGGAIIGCIATTWNQLAGQQEGNVGNIDDPERETLKQNFNKLRFTHAFPGSKTKRPVVAPLSLVRVDGDDNYYDVSLLNRPCLIKNEPPDFALDWKNNENTLKEYSWPYIRMKTWGWESLDTELRVRTAIDRDTLRSAKNKLFAYEQIIPDEKQWYAELDLSRIEEDQRGTVFTQLKSLVQEGFIGLGKTKTPVKITFLPISPFFITNNTTPTHNDKWVITLQTNTLLGSPAELNEISDCYALEKMYRQAWEELSGNTLTLKRYFARQKLSGGRHRYKTLQKNNEPYRPWLLTEAGSVFVLQATDKAHMVRAQSIIETWLAQGLPICDSACQCYHISRDTDQQWQSTPFSPQNGYGEIAVNITESPCITLSDGDNRTTPIDLIGNPVVVEDL